MNKKYNLLVPKILDINVMGIENFISYNHFIILDHL